MTDICETCKTPLGDGKFHCRTCHMSHALGDHGWVAVESRYDPDHRQPREAVKCPTCLVRIGREAPREDEREYQEWRNRGAR